MRIKKKEEAEQVRRNGKKMKNVVGSIEKKVTGSYVKDFRKAKHDLGRQKLLADWERSFIHQRAKQDSR